MRAIYDRIADGRTDLVFDVVSAGQPATSKDDGGTPLIRTCHYYGDVSALKFLLSQGETLAALGDNLDLNGACFHGHWRLAEYLVEMGADVNRVLPDTGESPLHAALCKADRPAYDHVVRVLLAYGADPNVATTPNVETGGFMRDTRTKGETPLHRAAAFATEACIQLLLDAGAAKDAKDMNGDSPLSWASWHLRPNAILAKLCFGEHFIRRESIGRSTSDHGRGWGDGMEVNLLGRPHIERVARRK
jgi:ankyrin repeat protein